MPLLCISIFALLLLPFSLSCDRKGTAEKVGENYRLFVEIDLNNTNSAITGLLQNSPCPALKQRLQKCTPDNKNIMGILHSLTCKMKNLSVNHTVGLVRNILYSLDCPCKENPTEVPRTTRRRRRSEQIERQKIKKLCKVGAILSEMTNCYQMLNVMLTDTLKPNSSSSQS